MLFCRCLCLCICTKALLPTVPTLAPAVQPEGGARSVKGVATRRLVLTRSGLLERRPQDYEASVGMVACLVRTRAHAFRA